MQSNMTEQSPLTPALTTEQAPLIVAIDIPNQPKIIKTDEDIPFEPSNLIGPNLQLP